MPTSLIRPIGDRPLSLAMHLRRVAELLQCDACNYSWTSNARCNAGLLIRSLTGWTEDALWRERVDSNIKATLWGPAMAEYVVGCAVNPGMKLPVMLEKLKVLGFEPQDFGHVENLSHPEILRYQIAERWRRVVPSFLIPGKVVRRSYANDVAWYFKNWATLIEAYRAANPEPALAPTEAVMDAIERRPLVTV